MKKLNIESQLRKIRIHTTYDVIEYYHKLSDIEEDLKNFNFFKCHRSYIVNLNYVRSYDNVFITLKNGEKIYMPKYKLTDFLRAFMYYLKSKGLKILFYIFPFAYYRNPILFKL